MKSTDSFDAWASSYKCSTPAPKKTPAPTGGKRMTRTPGKSKDLPF